MAALGQVTGDTDAGAGAGTGASAGAGARSGACSSASGPGVGNYFFQGAKWATENILEGRAKMPTQLWVIYILFLYKKQ